MTTVPRAEGALSPMSLTELAAKFDMTFRQCVSYRKGYVVITPDIKVKGKSKLHYSARQAAKFLADRKLFKAKMVREVVAKFLAGMDERDRNGDLFDYVPEGGQDPRADILALTWFVTFDPEDHNYILIHSIGTTYPDGSGRLEPTQDRLNGLVKALIDAGWRFTVISLGEIKSELYGRLIAHSRCLEYRAPSKREEVLERLHRLQDEAQSLPPWPVCRR